MFPLNRLSAVLYHQLFHKLDILSTVIRWHTRKFRSNLTEERKQMTFSSLSNCSEDTTNPDQQANFLQLHLREAALRFYQTLPAAIRANVENNLTALRDPFCNPQLQEVHVLKLEQLRYDSKTDSAENFLPDLPAVDPIDVALNGAPLVADTARFHRETAQ